MLFGCLNDSNEGILGGKAETRGFMVKCEERPIEGDVCEIPVRPPMNDGVMETVECLWVDIWCMLDWVIGLCHKTAEMHFPGMGCSTSETLLWLTEMECVKIEPITRLNIRRPNMVKRGLVYSKQNRK